MDSVLETQRKFHEERERLVDTIVKEIMSEKRTHKAKINSEHRVRGLLDRYNECTEELSKIYRDEDRAREREIEAVSGPNEFAEYYSRLKTLREAHRRNPDELAEPLSLEFQKMVEEINDPEREEHDIIEFTDEEGYGRFLDLQTIYLNYINLKGIKRIDYIAYLSIIDKFQDIQRTSTKKTGAYKDYLIKLKDYLVTFINRTRPMFDLDEELAKNCVETEKALADGSLQGWSTEKAAGVQPSAIDLSKYNSAQELEGLGLERLKSALQALQLKCGGTLKERAERLYATKGQSSSDLEKSLLSKNSEDERRDQERVKLLAKLEGNIKCMCTLLSTELEDTKENVERKQTRAAGEIEEEEEEVEVVSEEEDTDGIPYNPKNLPLGWDGRPIPYWLYKLHGLNLSYSCEICGNQTYKGPKAFQKHFNEWRHSHGMRCLGIPNTAHFANITKIEDALELWAKIKTERELMKWNPEMDEEFEDSAGNVVNKKMYEDLKRQGLL
ncbi:unnamed protein product [Auanema sp. JU1783]|nr:unnamed protein product [Auanema sp. JU1783]